MKTVKKKPAPAEPVAPMDREAALAILARLQQLDFWANEFESLVRPDRQVTDSRVKFLQLSARQQMRRLHELVVSYDLDNDVEALRQYVAGKEQYCSYGRELFGRIWDAAHDENRDRWASADSKRQSKRSSKPKLPVTLEDIRTFQDEYIKEHGRLKKGWKKACRKKLQIGIDAINYRLKQNEGSNRG